MKRKPKRQMVTKHFSANLAKKVWQNSSQELKRMVLSSKGPAVSHTRDASTTHRHEEAVKRRSPSMRGEEKGLMRWTNQKLDTTIISVVGANLSASPFDNSNCCFQKHHNLHISVPQESTNLRPKKEFWSKNSISFQRK